MKKLMPLVAVMFLFSASAHTGHSELPEPGKTPGDPFYFIDILEERMELALAPGQGARMEKRLEMADERLAESKALSDRNHTNLSKQTFTSHRRMVEKANETASGNATLEERVSEYILDRRTHVRQVGRAIGMAEPQEEETPSGAFMAMGGEASEK